MQYECNIICWKKKRKADKPNWSADWNVRGRVAVMIACPIAVHFFSYFSQPARFPLSMIPMAETTWGWIRELPLQSGGEKKAELRMARGKDYVAEENIRPPSKKTKRQFGLHIFNRDTVWQNKSQQFSSKFFCYEMSPHKFGTPSKSLLHPCLAVDQLICTF